MNFHFSTSLKDLIGPMACHCNVFSKDVKQGEHQHCGGELVSSQRKQGRPKYVVTLWYHKDPSPLTKRALDVFFCPHSLPFFGKIGAPQGLIPSLLPFRTRWEALVDVTIAYDFPLRYFY